MTESYFMLRGLLLVSLFSTALAAQDEPKQQDIRLSVVRVSATQRYSNLLRPWLKQPPQQMVGSGVVIEGNRVLTNSHLVNYASSIYVTPFQSGEKLAAKVAAISPGMDLAVLQLVEKDDLVFFDKHPAVPISKDLPKVRDTITAYGYPVGGASQSTTRGAVARIEYTNYNFNQHGLRIEVSAPLNVGNSGGPAIVDGQMAGLVFGISLQAQGAGYLLPSDEILMFLKDIEDGQYDGKPMTWFDMFNLENHALRAKLDLDRDLTGILVGDCYFPTGKGPLQPGDIITHIGQHKLDNMGMVQADDGLRLAFQYFLPKIAKDRVVPLQVHRGGAPTQVELALTNDRDRLLLPYLRTEHPSYFVWGPLCFTAATGDLVDALNPYLAAKWAISSSPVVLRRMDFKRSPDEQLVMVTTMFPHRISQGYGGVGGKVVSTVNGIKIRNLNQLVETLRDCRDKFVEIQFADRHSERLVFDRREASEAMEEILGDNGIRQICSADLTEVWNDGEPQK